MPEPEREASNKKPEVVECVQCSLEVGQGEHALQCDRCDGWIHCICTDVADELYSCLQTTSSKVVRIICLPCLAQGSELTVVGEVSLPNRTCIEIPSVSTCISSQSTPVKKAQHKKNSKPITTAPESPIKLDSSSYAEVVRSNLQVSSSMLNAKIASNDADYNALQLRLTQLENLVLTKASSARKAEHTSLGPKSKPKISRPEIGLSEVQQRSRARSLIIFNVPEPEGESNELKSDQERAFLQSLVSKLFDVGEDGVTVSSAFRLGRIHETPGQKPRPLKVVLASEEQSKCY